MELLGKAPELVVKKESTKGPGDASEIARRVSGKSDVIIAVGGDGTCNEVLNGLMLESNPEIVFGVIPNGTGNDFARNFAPFDPPAFVQAIIESSTMLIDIGKIHFEKNSKYFLNVADIGFGACVIETMNRQRKSRVTGKLSYSLAIIRTFFTYRKPVLRVFNTDFEFEGKALMIVFSNGSTFGNGLQIYPDAKLDSGKLGLIVIGDVSLMEYAKNLGNLKKGRRIDHPQVKYFEFEKISVSTVNKDLWVEMDGEIAGRSSITVEVLPKALKIVN